MARKLKVYAADIDGLHDWVVAAPNQKEALAAFGVNQDLFEQGRAVSTDAADAVEAAVAAPGIPLRRLKGSAAEYQPVEAGGSGGWDQAAKAAGVKPRRNAAKAKPDRSRLDRATQDLKTFEREAEVEAQALERRREALLNAQAERRAELQAALDRAEADFRARG